MDDFRDHVHYLGPGAGAAGEPPGAALDMGRMAREVSDLILAMHPDIDRAGWEHSGTIGAIAKLLARELTRPGGRPDRPRN